MQGKKRHIAIVGLLVAGLVSASLWWVGGGARRHARRLALLESADAGARKQAAWSLVDDPDPELIALIGRRLLGPERSADVRESFVWTLGSLHDPRSFPAIEEALDVERDGYVRAAAWLAAARADGARFEHLAEQQPPASLWDRIGIAQGRLALGNVADVGLLLDVAATGSDQQRYVAGRALHKWLRPLLETAGRWPLDEGGSAAGAWPAEFVALVARRCAELDLPAIAADNRRFAAALARLHRDVARITNARNDLAGLLFDR